MSRPAPELPVSMEISIASAQTAIEWWLREKVLRADGVVVGSVTFDHSPHGTGVFTVKLDRTSKADS